MIEKKRAALIIFLMAMAIRMVFVVARSQGHGEINGDAFEYDSYAQNLLAHGRYVNNQSELAGRMPGYPIFLAGLYALFSHSVLVVQIVQCVLSSLVCVFVFLIALRLLPYMWAMTAGAISIFYLDAFIGCPRILSETLYVFLISVSWMFWFYGDWKRWRTFLAFGAMIGLTALVRPEACVYAGVAGCLAFWQSRRRWVSCFILWVGVLIFLAPWTLRNYYVFKRFLPTTTRSGFNAYIGLQIPLDRTGSPPVKPMVSDQLPEVERDRLYAKAAKELYRATPWAALFKAYFYNAAVFLYPFRPTYDPTLVFWIPFWLYGIVSYKRMENKRGILIVAYFFFATLSYIVFGATVARYRECVAPATILLAAVGLLSFHERVSRPQFRTVLIVWGCVNLLIWVNAPYVRKILLDSYELFLKG